MTARYKPEERGGGGANAAGILIGRKGGGRSRSFESMESIVLFHVLFLIFRFVDDLMICML